MHARLCQIGDYWLSPRPNSDAWCRTYFDATTRQTRRTSLGTSDIREVEIRLAEWVVSNARVSQQTPQAAPLEQVLLRYWHRKGKALASAEVTRIALAYWSDGFPGAVVSDLTPARQREFVARLQAAGKSDGYIKRILGVGKAALNEAYREGEIETVPFVLPGEDRHATWC